MGKSLDQLGRAKRFTQLDQISSYHWIMIREGDEWKTAFQIRNGRFEYQVLFFGLSNTPANFQGYINKILVGKLDIFIIVYLDNILIYTENPGQLHVEAVRTVLDQFRKHSLFANLKKCRFPLDEVRFLGFVVSAKGIRIEEKKIKAVKTWPEPKSVRDIQVFLGFANFYRRFIKSFSRIAGPLTLILRTTPSASPPTSGSKEAVNSTSNSVESGVVSGVGGAGGAGSIGGKTKNLSKTKNLKKLAKSKKPDFEKAKNRNGAFRKDFFTPKARFAFTRLPKVFTDALILHHFDPGCHIRI